MPRNKLCNNFDEAVADIRDGAVIMVGGFGVAGDTPQNLILALRNHGARNLTIITNSAGTGGKLAAKWWGMPYFADPNLLAENRQVKKLICSISFPDTAFEKAILAGEVGVEWVPQGTLAERIRAGGFGIGGFYTPTGVGTLVEEGKEKRIINGKEYLLELPLRGDYALIKAYKADKYGNLVYRGNTRSFNAVMAPAAKVTIAEVDEIVEVGELEAEAIDTPEVFVHRVVKVAKEKP